MPSRTPINLGTKSSLNIDSNICFVEETSKHLRAMEKTHAHSIQDKLESSNTFTILYFIFGNYYELTHCVENSVDPDQLAS